MTPRTWTIRRARVSDAEALSGCIQAAYGVYADHLQGRGLGRGLIEFGEAQAGKQGYKELRLATHRLLTENLSLYSHLGWTETGRDSSRVFFRKILTD